MGRLPEVSHGIGHAGAGSAVDGLSHVHPRVRDFFPGK
jgi:hypothetical protein